MHLEPHIEVLTIWTLIDSIDLLAKTLVKRLVRDLLMGLLWFPFVFALFLVLMFDAWLIVSGTFLTL